MFTARSACPPPLNRVLCSTSTILMMAPPTPHCSRHLSRHPRTSRYLLEGEGSRNTSSRRRLPLPSACQNCFKRQNWNLSTLQPRTFPCRPSSDPSRSTLHSRCLARGRASIPAQAHPSGEAESIVPSGRLQTGKIWKGATNACTRRGSGPAAPTSTCGLSKTGPKSSMTCAS